MIAYGASRGFRQISVGGTENASVAFAINGARVDLRNSSANRAHLISPFGMAGAGTEQRLARTQIGQIEERMRAHRENLAADALPSRSGPDEKPPEMAKENDRLPLQRIYAVDGKVMMEGHASSREELIVQKLEEAKNSTDPAKQTVSLAGANLSGMKFDKINMSQLDLRGANLNGASFTDCKLDRVDMSNAEIKGTTFSNCDISHATMSGVKGDQRTKMTNTALFNVDLNSASMPGAKFESVRAEYLMMNNANLSGATLTDVGIRHMHADQLNLSGANMAQVGIYGESVMRNVNMEEAHLHDCAFGTMKEGIDLSGLRAANAEFDDVSFGQSHLSNANFAGADFKNTDMRYVQTPEGAMNMDLAHVDGLMLGPRANVQAEKIISNGQAIDLHALEQPSNEPNFMSSQVFSASKPRRLTTPAPSM